MLAWRQRSAFSRRCKQQSAAQKEYVYRRFHSLIPHRGCGTARRRIPSSTSETVSARSRMLSMVHSDSEPGTLPKSMKRLRPVRPVGLSTLSCLVMSDSRWFKFTHCLLQRCDFKLLLHTFRGHIAALIDVTARETPRTAARALVICNSHF